MARQGEENINPIEVGAASCCKKVESFIMCKQCSNCFHIKCVKLTKAAVENLTDPWLCKACSKLTVDADQCVKEASQDSSSDMLALKAMLISMQADMKADNQSMKADIQSMKADMKADILSARESLEEQNRNLKSSLEDRISCENQTLKSSLEERISHENHSLKVSLEQEANEREERLRVQIGSIGKQVDDISGRLLMFKGEQRSLDDSIGSVRSDVEPLRAELDDRIGKSEQTAKPNPHKSDVDSTAMLAAVGAMKESVQVEDKSLEVSLDDSEPNVSEENQSSTVDLDGTAENESSSLKVSLTGVEVRVSKECSSLEVSEEELTESHVANVSNCQIGIKDMEQIVQGEVNEGGQQSDQVSPTDFSVQSVQMSGSNKVERNDAQPNLASKAKMRRGEYATTANNPNSQNYRRTYNAFSQNGKMRKQRFKLYRGVCNWRHKNKKWPYSGNRCYRCWHRSKYRRKCQNNVDHCQYRRFSYSNNSNGPRFFSHNPVVSKGRDEGGNATVPYPFSNSNPTNNSSSCNSSDNVRGVHYHQLIKSKEFGHFNDPPWQSHGTSSLDDYSWPAIELRIAWWIIFHDLSWPAIELRIAWCLVFRDRPYLLIELMIAWWLISQNQLWPAIESMIAWCNQKEVIRETYLSRHLSTISLYACVVTLDKKKYRVIKYYYYYHSVCLATGYAPAELFINYSALDNYRKSMHWPEDFKKVSLSQRHQLILENVERSHRKRKAMKPTGEILKENDLVFVKQFPRSSSVQNVIAKYFLKYVGPFIVHRLHRNSAELVTLDGQPVGIQNFHNLKLFQCSDERRQELLSCEHLPGGASSEG